MSGVSAPSVIEVKRRGVQAKRGGKSSTGSRPSQYTRASQIHHLTVERASATLVVGWMGSQLAVGVLIRWSRKPETGPRAISRPISAVVGHSAAQRPRLSRFEYWRVVRVDQALGGAFARASILRCALTNRSCEGCPRPRRMVSPLACRTTPASKIDDPKAHRFQPFTHPLSAQHQPLHRRVQIECQHRYRPPRGVGSE